MKFMNVSRTELVCLTAIIYALSVLVSCNNTGGESETESLSAYTKDDIVGEWYSGEIGGSFCFSDNNMLYLKVDISDTMYMNDSNIMCISGSDEDYSDNCSFDGKNYSFDINGINMLTMSRDKESESAFGEYSLESGVMYEELSSIYGNLDGRYNIIADSGVFDAKIYICNYEISDRNVIAFSGDDLEFFGVNKEQGSTFNFAVQKDVLTLVESDNSAIVFSKIN